MAIHQSSTRIVHAGGLGTIPGPRTRDDNGTAAESRQRLTTEDERHGMIGAELG
jgi:hypothetical protein